MIYLVGCREENLKGILTALSEVEDIQIYFPDGSDPDAVLQTSSLRLSDDLVLMLVSFQGTTSELKRTLGLGEASKEGHKLRGFIFEVSAFAGFWSKDMWEWCRRYFA